MTPAPPPDARWRPVAALLLVGAGAAALILTSPNKGWTIGTWTLRWEWPEPWMGWLAPADEQPVIPRWKPEDVQDLLNDYDAQLQALEQSDPASPPVDSSAWPPPAEPVSPPLDTPSKSPEPVPVIPPASPAEPLAPSLPSALRIRMEEGALPAFHRLFAKLKAGEDVHVLHYGDSQIEGDRISGTLRHRWQDRWGGFGPGIQPPVPLVQSFALRQKQDGPWSRHTRFGRRDTLDPDENYGLLASYARLTWPTGTDPAQALSDSTAVGCMTFGQERRAHPSFGQWSSLELWHDTVHAPCRISVDGQPVADLLPGALPAALTLPMSNVGGTQRTREICFSGQPPRLFAVHPVGGGVQWHGVAMRGSSGTLFKKLSRRPFLDQLERISPDLVVLQFGGNSVPHCRDTASARRYAGWFQRQIQGFQQWQPEAAVLVIGPSDMAEKTGMNWTSYPLLVPTRDALLDATLDAGAAYWDVLEVMGGPGSMPAWVMADPPLAGPDHIHFTPMGARRIGELLDRALWAEFRRWERGTTALSGMAIKPPPSALSITQPAVNDSLR